MTRGQQVSFCEKCLNRKMDWQQGLVCNLTGKKATFQDECSNFNLDETTVITVAEAPLDDKKKLLLSFKRAQNNLLLVIILTAVNLILTICNVNLWFMFSAILPQFIFEVGKALDAEIIGSISFTTIGIVIALIVIGAYFIFWVLAERARVFILIALIFFSIDTLLLLFLMYIEFNIEFLFQIAFHGWVLYYLITGVIAWNKMRGVQIGKE